MIRAKYKSIITELTVVISAGLFLAIFLFLLITTLSYRSNIIAQEENKALLFAENSAIKIEAYLGNAAKETELISRSLSLISDKQTTDLLLQNILLQDYPINSYAIIDQQVFSANDSFGYNLNESKLNVYFWQKSLNNIIENSFKHEGNDEIAKTFLESSIYKYSKKSLKDEIIDNYIFPLQNSDIKSIVFSSPIIKNNNFYGVAGISLNKKTLQKMIDENHFLNTNTYMSVVSNLSTTVVSTQDNDLNYLNKRLSHIRPKKEQIQNIDKNLVISRAIIIGKSKNRWYIHFVFPKSIFKTNANFLTFIFIVMAIVFWLISVLGLYIYIKNITTPLLLFVKTIKDVGVGKLDIEKNFTEINEIGQMKFAFIQHVDKLKKIIGVLNSAANNDYSKSIKENNKEDILSIAVNQMNNTLQQTYKENIQRKEEATKLDWIQQGLNHFSNVMRQNSDNIEELGYLIIKNLIEYVGASQAGLFVCNDENKDDIYFELVAMYAYNRRKYQEKKIRPGQGLVGACILEKDIIHLTELPNDYIEINSGLGSAEPNSLLIVPLNHEDTILGAIEIASFNKFKPQDITFIKKLSEGIASTLSITKINARTAKLLIQSQDQARELARQESEMRSNLGKLQKARNESTKKELEMRGVLEAIKSTSLVAEYDINGNLLDINERFLKLFNTTKNEMIGKNHKDLTSITNTPGAFEAFWKDLRNGIRKIKPGYTKLSNGKEVWLVENFTPILNRKGKPYKILNIAFDLTENKQKELELTLQSEQLKQSELNLKNIIKAVDRTMMRVEYSTDGDFLAINKLFLHATGYTEEELIGKNAKFFVPSDRIDKFDQIWKSVCEGKNIEGIIPMKKKTGEILKLLISDAPVIDQNQEIVKILFMAFEIDEITTA